MRSTPRFHKAAWKGYIVCHLVFVTIQTGEPAACLEVCFGLKCVAQRLPFFVIVLMCENTGASAPKSKAYNGLVQSCSRKVFAMH